MMDLLNLNFLRRLILLNSCQLAVCQDRFAMSVRMTCHKVFVDDCLIFAGRLRACSLDKNDATGNLCGDIVKTPHVACIAFKHLIIAS